MSVETLVWWVSFALSRQTDRQTDRFDVDDWGRGVALFSCVRNQLNISALLYEECEILGNLSLILFLGCSFGK